eukprot:s1103_g4.t1
MSGLAEGQPSGVDEKTSNLWSLLPSFDPSTDSAKEYADKVRFLWGICPPKDRGMLAPRLALLCKGTAWSQVKSLSSEKLTNPETGYKVLLKALETWEEAEELQTFDKFEKAFYRVVQKSDESAMSFVNRINVAFDEVGPETTVQQVRAFVMLRQSSLTVEDKKRVVAMAGNYEPAKVESSMRALSTKVLGQGDVAKKKVYAANFVEDEPEEIQYAGEEELDEEQILAALIEEGDETALAIQDFEDQVIHVCQDSPELAMAFSTYQEARQKLRDRVRSRGFWPLKGFKGRGGKGKNKKGKGQKKYQSLAERIANSTCRACGARGHWKDECPLREKSSVADANVILSEEPYGELSEITEEELLDELPEGDFANWQAGILSKTKGRSLPTQVPSEYHFVNEEFKCQSHEFVLHVSNLPKGKSSRNGTHLFPNFSETFRRAIETSFGVIGRSPENSEKDGSDSLGDSGTGIIDTGASKSVIGEKRVSALLSTLDPMHRKLVKWKESETVFRFGNNGVLKSVGALFVPFGNQWMKIEVVHGMTPFLISNSFLRALGADVLVSRSCLEVSAWNQNVPLIRNAKGLFIVKLSDLNSAASRSARSVNSEEVITLASSQNNNLSSGVYCTQQQLQQRDLSSTSKTTRAAEVAQLQVERELERPAPVRSPSSNKCHVEPECAEADGLSISGLDVGRLGCDAPRGGGPFSGLRRSSDARDQVPQASRSVDTSRVGAVEVPGREVAPSDLCSGLSRRSQVRQVYEGAQEVGLHVGPELPSLCGGDVKDGGGVLSQLLPGVCSPVGNGGNGKGRDGQEECPGGSNGDNSGTRVGAAEWVSDIESGKLEHQASDGRGQWQDGDRGDSERREAHSNGNSATRGGQDQSRAGGRVSESGSEACDATAITHELIDKIEMSMNAIETELMHLQKIWPRRKDQPDGSRFGLDLLEIYCEENSQITSQAQQLGLKAKRFTFKDGDLSTPEGQAALWKVLEEEKPREVWMAPDCKYWGNFSRRNMGRSKSTASKILDGREKQRVHLRLCNDVYWYQMDVGGQFHLEQPQGSEAIYQPEVRDIYYGTLCTVFDMCEVGKLLAPHVMRRVHGNNYLRKRTHVYTSSKIFHQAFDHRLCPGHHKHVPIAGKTYHLGRWISLSEYAARYTSGFGRNVARYVACRFDEKPLVLEELYVCDVEHAFVEGVVKRKRAAAAQEVPEASEPSQVKRPRYGVKQTPLGDHGCASGDFWDGVFKRLDPMVPRVGKRILDDEGILNQIQRGAPQIKVQRVEACRGTERLRLPGDDADPESIPLRLTVVKDRTTGRSMVLGPAEEWRKLSKRQQDVSCEGDELEYEIFSGKPPKNIPAHGPGFLELSSDEKAQIRRLHHNLGHPHPQRFAKFLKERHAVPSMVQGALDYQCDSCAETKAGPDSTRPATIHENIGFNHVVGMDTAVWTNQSGQKFSFSHIIDEGTLFHVGAPVVSADVESQLRVFERCWMLWAGPPQVVYVDPGTEYTAEAWQDRMQHHDIHVKVSASEAHWQLGRVEIHGSVVKRMLSRMDLEKPIRSSVEFERALTHVFNAKNSLSRVKGFSPEQAVLGTARKLPGSVMSGTGLGSLTLAEGTGPESEVFRDSLEMRSSARRAFIEADNSSSLRRALLRRTRPMRGPYEIGDLVLYWRRRGANMRRDHGRWYGPAAVVAELLTESGTNPQQFQRSLKDGVFIDLDPGDLPDDGVDSEGYDPSLGEPEGELSVPQPGTPSGDVGENRDVIVTEEPPTEETPVPDYVRVPVPESSSSESETDQVPDGPVESEDPILFGDDVSMFAGDSCCQLWELEIPVESSEELALFASGSADESVLLVSNAKKKRVEVRLSELSSADQLRMAVAKHKEIGAWLRHATVRKAAKGKIPEDAIMRCRWLLTWKSASPDDKPEDVSDGKRAKARLIVVGYEDPGVGVVQNDSPTLSKDGRQLVVQQVSSHGWQLISFDVATAFLQGEGDGRLLGLHPTPELTEALGLEPGDQCQLVGSAYGRVDAPFLWFCKFRDALLEEGFKQCPFDPCVFVLSSIDKSGKHKVHGSLGIHVDDGIGGGDQKFMEVLERVRKRFSFGSFEKGSFVFTGIRFRQWDDGSVEYDQIEYIDKISPIEIPKYRRAGSDSPLTPGEVTQLRSLIGALQYAAVHTRPDIAAKVGEIQSRVTKATVSDLVFANKVLHEAKSHPVTLMTLPITPDQVTFCAFSDASFLSGKEKYAHQGGLIFVTTPELLDNQRAVVAPVAWMSKKIHRVTRSTLGAEAIALSGNVDRLLWLRIMWQWLNDPLTEWQSPEKALQNARKAALVTDCKSAYDLLTRAAVPQCEEHRTTIECLLIRERLQANCMVRWVTSNAQLADCLTKSMDASVLRQCLKSGRYSLFDEGRILQERSDKRQRLKWAKEATTQESGVESALKCTDQNLQDSWEHDSLGQVAD